MMISQRFIGFSKEISQHVSKSSIWMEQSGHGNANNDIRGYVHKSKEETSPSLLLAWKPFQRAISRYPLCTQLQWWRIAWELFSSLAFLFLRFLRFWRRKSIYYKSFETNSLSVSKMWQTLEAENQQFQKYFSGWATLAHLHSLAQSEWHCNF